MFEQLSVDHLYKSQDEWENLKSYLSDPFFKDQYEKNQKALTELRAQAKDNVLDVPWMLHKESLRKPIENRVVKNIAHRTAVAWFIDGRQEDLDYLWKVLDYFIEHCPWTIESRDGAFGRSERQLHADLETADASYVVSFVLDTYRDLIPADLRERLIERVVNGSIKGYLDGIEHGDWWRYANFNWGAALHGGNACAALALWDSHRALATEVLKQALRGLQYIMDDISRGSVCTEGQMYQTTTINHLTDFLSVWHRLTGDHQGWLDNHYMEISIDFHMHMQGGDGDQLNFSNCTAGNMERGGAHFYWWARQYNRPEWAAYEEQITRHWGDTHGAFNSAEAFWYREPHQESAAPQLKQHFHFPGLDWMTFHTGDMWGSFRSGYNGNNHNHKSLGHFILGFKKQRFLVAPGYGAGRPEQHNIAVAGEQADSAEARIVRIRQWEDGLYWVCNLQNAYPNRTNIFHRHMLIIENTHVLVIDHVIGKQGKRPGVKWFLQTECASEFVGEGATLNAAAENMQIDYLVPTSGHDIKDWEFGSNNKGEAKMLKTLSWTLDSDDVEVFHPMMLSFEKKAYDYTCDGKTASVTMGKRRYEFDLYDLAFRVEEL